MDAAPTAAVDPATQVARLSVLEDAARSVVAQGERLLAFSRASAALSGETFEALRARIRRLGRTGSRVEEELRVQRVLVRLGEDEKAAAKAGGGGAGSASSSSGGGGMVFQFVESALVTAIREGHWVLLDGVNSAPPEVVERLNSLAEERPVLNLFESDRPELLAGDKVHRGFRLLASASGNRESASKLSSAFLNRMVRIWLDAGDADLRAEKGKGGLSAPLQADAALVAHNVFQGVHGGAHLVQILVGFHGEMLRAVAAGRVHPMANATVTMRSLIFAARSAVIMTRRGVLPLAALAWAIVRHYISSVQSPAGVWGGRAMSGAVAWHLEARGCLHYPLPLPHRGAPPAQGAGRAGGRVPAGWRPLPRPARAAAGLHAHPAGGARAPRDNAHTRAHGAPPPRGGHPVQPRLVGRADRRRRQRPRPRSAPAAAAARVASSRRPRCAPHRIVEPHGEAEGGPACVSRIWRHVAPYFRPQRSALRAYAPLDLADLPPTPAVLESEFAAAVDATRAVVRDVVENTSLADIDARLSLAARLGGIFGALLEAATAM